MEVDIYLNILIKKIWIIILFAIIGSSAAAYYSYYSYKPIYTSSSTLLIISSEYDPNNPISLSDVMTGQQLVKEYGEIIKSRSVAREVADGLKLSDINASVILRSLKVTLKDETRLLIVSITNKNAIRTKQIIDKINEVFIKRVKSLSTYADVSVIDEAELPTAPIPPNHKTKALIGLLAGLIGSVALIFLFEELDDTVKTAEDVEKLLDLKVLGTIPTLNLK